MLRSHSKALNKKDEMTRRISDDEEKLINQGLSTLEAVPETIQALMKAMSKPHWEKDETKSINHPKMPLYALIAFQEKNITKEQFSTLLLYHSIREYYSNDDKITSTFFQFDTTDPKLSEEAKFTLAKINEEISKLPLSEQIAFVVPLELEETDVLLAIGTHINNLTYGVPLEDNQLRIPSLSILQILVNHQHKYPATFNPVIGLSSLEDIIKNGHMKTRDIALHFPFVNLLNTADFTMAKLFKFTLHDFYHLLRFSDVPIVERDIFLEIGKIIENTAAEKSAEPESKSIAFVANYFYDMDFPHYTKGFKRGGVDYTFSSLSPEYKFLLTIAAAFAVKDQLNFVKDKLIDFTELPPITDESRKEIAFKILDYLTVKAPHYAEYIKEKVFYESFEARIPEKDIHFIAVNYAHDFLKCLQEYHSLFDDKLPLSTKKEPLVIQEEKEIGKLTVAEGEESLSSIKKLVEVKESADSKENSLQEAKELSQADTSTPAISDKLMQWGSRISATFDTEVALSTSQMLYNQEKAARWMTKGVANDQISSDVTPITAAFAFHSGIINYSYKNPFRYLLLPVADTSAKIIGGMTYLAGALISQSIFRRNDDKPSPKLEDIRPEVKKNM